MPDDIPRIEINLDVLRGNLSVRLQHLSDILKIAAISSRVVDDSQFNAYSTFMEFNVAPAAKLDLCQAKEFFYQWCLTNNFRDSVEHCGIFLEECNLVCELLKARSNNKIKAENIKDIYGKNKDKFHKRNFPDKINYLRKEYSVSSVLEEHILSLNRTRNCLVHRGGVVGAMDANEAGVLEIKYRAFQLSIQSVNGGEEVVIDEPMTVGTKTESNAFMKLTDFKKEFKTGEKIKFSPKEHPKTICTFWLFGNDIHQSMCKAFDLGAEAKSPLGTP